MAGTVALTFAPATGRHDRRVGDPQARDAMPAKITVDHGTLVVADPAGPRRAARMGWQGAGLVQLTLFPLIGLVSCVGDPPTKSCE
jgi:hypothetical protein